MAKYASKTSVSPNQSLTDIQAVLDRYGCKNFAFGRQDDQVMVMFEMDKRQVRFIVRLPDEKDREYTHTPSTGKLRSTQSAKDTYDQAIRQRWRALLLTIKAKLESVESEIETFEEAFMGQLLIPGGQTVGEWIAPQLDQIYATGNLPPLLGRGS